MPWRPDYATDDELKQYLRIEDDADDLFIAMWITATSRNVDDFCGRQFGQVDTPENRVYPSVYDRHEGAWSTVIDDVMDVAGLVVTDQDGNQVTDYQLWPRNAAAKGKPYERMTTSTGGDLTVFASWGWTPASAGPTVAKAGMLLQAARLAARRDSPFGIAGSPTVGGGEIQLLAQLDPDFRTTMKPHRRDWWAA